MRATLIFLAVFTAAAQTPATKPEFEAASVKSNTTGGNSSSSNGSKGQLVIVNNSLHRLIERAYSVKAFQVTGPDWLDAARFDVMAKYPEGSKNEDSPAMLRTLLEERFKLATHDETREMPGYELVVAKGGLKIKPVEKGESGTSSNSSNTLVTLQVTSIDMAGFADFLGRRLGSAVVDRTKADNFYTFDLRWSLDPEGTAIDRTASEFAAIQDAIAPLGLHLQAAKVPVQVVVVDHAERVPSDN
jgi:bla regulator protein BlaR1